MKQSVKKTMKRFVKYLIMWTLSTVMAFIGICAVFHIEPDLSQKAMFTLICVLIAAALMLTMCDYIEERKAKKE